MITPPIDTTAREAAISLRALRFAAYISLTTAIVLAIVAPVLAWDWPSRVPLLGVMTTPQLITSSLAGADWGAGAYSNSLQLYDRVTKINSKAVDVGNVEQNLIALSAFRSQFANVVFERNNALNPTPCAFGTETRPGIFTCNTDVALAKLSSLDVTRFFVVPYLVALVYLAAGLWALRVRGGSRAGIFFVLLCSSMSMVFSSYFDFFTTHRLYVFYILSLSLIPPMLISLGLFYPSEFALVRRLPAIRFVVNLPAILFGAYVAYLASAGTDPWGYLLPAQGLYFSLGGGLVVFAGTNAYRIWRPPSLVVRQQSQISLFALVLAILPFLGWGVQTMVNPRALFDPLLYFPLLVVFPIVFGYSMVRYRLLGVDDVISELEQRVNARTTELAQVNATLRAEVAERARAEQAVLRQNEFLTALHDTTLGLINRLDTADLLQTIVRRAAQLVRTSHGYIFLVNQTEHRLERKVSLGIFEDSTDAQMNYGQGMAGKVWETKQSLIVSNYDQWAGRLPSFTYGVIRAVAAVPLRSGEEVLGVLGLGHDFKSSETFSEDDINILTRFAQLASIAIVNARLFENERRRANEQEALRATLADISAQTDLNTVLTAVLRRSVELLDATGGDLGIYDEATKTLRILASYNLQQDYAGISMQLGEGAAGIVAQTRQPLIIEDYQTWPQRSAQFTEETWRSILAVPMLVSNRLVGVITITDANPERRFTEDSQRLLQLFASQAAVAIENARLFQQIGTQVRELEMLYDASKAVTSTLELRKVMEAITSRLARVLEVEVAAVSFWDREMDELVNEHWYAIDGDTSRFSTERYFLKDYPLTARVLAEGQPLAIYKDQPLIDQAELKFLKQVQAQALLMIPLAVRGRVIGLVELLELDNKPTRREFDPARIRLAEALSAQAAAALDSARLFQQTQIALNETESLYRASRRLSAANDLQEVIAAIVEEIRVPVVDRAVLFTVTQDAQGNEDGFMISANWHDGKGLLPMPINTRYNMAAMAAFKLVLTDQPLFIEDAQTDPRMDAATLALVQRLNIRAMAVLPLWIDTKQMGALLIESKERYNFTQREIRPYLALAAQMAVIIDRRRTEEARRVSESELRALFAAMRDVIIVYDADGHYVEVAPTNPALLMLPPQEMVGKTVYDLLPEEHATLFLNHIRYVLHTKQTAYIEYSLEIAGREVWFAANASPFLENNVIWVARDITERKHSEQALRQSEERHRMLLELSPDPIIIYNMEGYATYLNAAFEQVFGWPRTELLGKRVPFVPDDPTVKESTAQAFQRLFRDGRVVAFDSKRLTLDGRLLDVQISASLLRNAEGVPQESLIVLRDITEQKRAEIELQNAKEAAEAGSRAKSEFLANMSHEIRTPMNAVIGMTGLLLDTTLSHEQHDYAETIRSSGEALLTIINDILDFSKIEAGRLDMELRPFGVRECVDTALDLLAPRAAEKNLNLASRVAANVPNLISGDANRLRQVLVNLIGNAVKFTERGEIVVEVDLPIQVATAMAAPPSIPMLHFAVRDTGIGIPADRMDRLFQSFSQVDASTTRKYGGTGLGLVISKRLCEMMGGKMWVESELGKGSTFHFTIRAEVAKGTAPLHLKNTQPHLAGKRLLIVDDNQTNRLIVREQAYVWNMSVREATSGPEALELLNAGEAFDVAVLDMQMPQMDGNELAEAIHNLPASATLPLIMVTSLGRREGDEVADPHFTAYLTKPLKSSQLYNALIAIFVEQPKPPTSRGSETVFDTSLGTVLPLKILLAEDNAVNQKLALLLLERMGYRAEVATNGLEAIAALEREAYDVILMDMQMPEMDGLEATRQIVRRWQAKRPRIIAMTANAMQEDREACLAAGMDDYISKPVQVRELQAALRRWGQKVERIAPVAVAPAPALNLPEAVDAKVIEELRSLQMPDEPDIVEKFFATFAREAPTLILAMREAVQSQAPDKLRQAAHSLKGSSGGLGAKPLAALCAEIEKTAKGGGVVPLTQIEQVESEFQRVLRTMGL